MTAITNKRAIPNRAKNLFALLYFRLNFDLSNTSDQILELDLLRDNAKKELLYIVTYTIEQKFLELSSTNFQSQIATSNRTYSFNFDPSAFDKDTGSYTANGSVLADMDANDTCTFRIYQSGGLDQVDISSVSTVSGFLAC